MNDDQALPNDMKHISGWILLGRHLVAIAALIAVYYKVSSVAADDFFVFWPALYAMVFVLSAVIAGLVLLFFTKTERGKSLITFRNVAWTLSLLLFLDPLSRVLESKPNKRTKGTTSTLKYSPAELPSQQQSPTTIQEAANVNPAPRVATRPSQSAECPNPSSGTLSERRVTLARVRQDYPALAGLDDDAVAIAMREAFYKDLSLDCIAYSLGVEISMSSNDLQK